MIDTPMRCANLLRFPVLFAWEFAAGIALLGWGSLLLRLSRSSQRSIAAAGVAGVSLLLACSSVANSLRVVRPGVIYVFVAIGILLLVGARELRPPARAWFSENLRGVSWIPAAVGVFFFGALLLANVGTHVWNADDLDGYMPIAVKTLQMGALQSDPYSDRRMTTGLGGGALLDAYMLAPGDIRAMHFIDSVFGLFLFAAGVWTAGRRWGVSRFAMGLILCVLPIVPLAQANLTIVYLSAATFLVMALLLSEERSAGSEILLGFLAAGVCATKSTNIPYIVILLGSTLLLRRLCDRDAPLLRPLAIVSAVALALLAPLSIAQHDAEGTYLYPLLGRGFHQSAFGVLPAPAELGTPAFIAILTVPICVLLLAGAMFAWRLKSYPHPARRGIVTGMLLANALTVPIIAFGTGGESLDRYTSPFIVPAALLFCLMVISAWKQSPKISLPPLRGASIAALLLMSYLIGFVGFAEMWNHSLRMAFESLIHRDRARRYYEAFVSKGTLEYLCSHVSRAQAAIPPGASAVEIMQFPTALDFRRNPVYIADMPGMAGPSPMPLGQGPEALRKYLASHGIEYVIMDRDRYGMRPSLWPAFKAHPRNVPDVPYILSHLPQAHLLATWSHMQDAVGSDVQRNLHLLSRSQPSIYDDGELLVFRLN